MNRSLPAATSPRMRATEAGARAELVATVHERERLAALGAASSVQSSAESPPPNDHQRARRQIPPHRARVEDLTGLRRPTLRHRQVRAGWNEPTPPATIDRPRRRTAVPPSVHHAKAAVVTLW
jgi:hypothetical protein